MKFDRIYNRAAKRKGEENLQELLNSPTKSIKELSAISSEKYLSEMTKAIFKAGFVWKVIDNKWSGFEEAFWHFNVSRCAWMSHEDLESLYKDSRIVKNAKKINTVPINAAMILELEKEHESFAHMIAHWPNSDFIGLLDLLNKKGSRLGRLTSQYFLRFIGKDGFIFSRDVVAALIDAEIIDKQPTSKTALNNIQNAFNQWSDESGLGLAKISRTLGMSIDA